MHDGCRRAAADARKHDGPSEFSPGRTRIRKRSARSTGEGSTGWVLWEAARAPQPADVWTAGATAKPLGRTRYQLHLMFGRESHGREVCSRCRCDGSRSRARDGGWCMCVILMHRAAADRREPESLRGRCADRRTLGGNIAISDRLANRHDAGAFPSVPVLKAGRPDDPATLRQGQRPPTSSRRQGGRAVKRHSGQGSRRLVMHDVVRAWAPAGRGGFQAMKCEFPEYRIFPRQPHSSPGLPDSHGRS